MSKKKKKIKNTKGQTNSFFCHNKRKRKIFFCFHAQKQNFFQQKISNIFFNVTTSHMLKRLKIKIKNLYTKYCPKIFQGKTAAKKNKKTKKINDKKLIWNSPKQCLERSFNTSPFVCFEIVSMLTQRICYSTTVLWQPSCHSFLHVLLLGLFRGHTLAKWLMFAL